jgi:Ca2+-transporting ATPase
LYIFDVSKQKYNKRERCNLKKEWYLQSVEEVTNNLQTDINTGLTNEQVAKKQVEYGLNQLKAKKKKSLLKKFINQFKDFTIIVLIIAAIVSGIVGVSEGEGITDTVIILIVVILNAVIGVAQESKAEKSLEALQKLSDHSSKVIRNGKLDVIPSKMLVPGDIVVLETGDYIPADLRIVEAVNLKVQESALTGESVPIEKQVQELAGEDIGIADRNNMLFSSSLVTYGRGKGIVVETGMNTEVGKIATMLDSTEENITPLQQKLNGLGKILGIVALAICAVIFVIGLLYGKEPIHMFMTAVSLAVAAIPEGLVAVSTIVLAVGVRKNGKEKCNSKKAPSSRNIRQRNSYLFG